MKKIIALLLALCMVLAMAACGTGSKPVTTTPNSDMSADQGESDVPAYVTEPITINFWHTLGSGEAAQYIADAVSRFNKENEYGITVNATYMGGYGDVRSKAITSIGAGDPPQVIIVNMTNLLASTGILLDMTPYAERDGLDLNAFHENTRASMYYEGQLTSMPIQRSCPLLYYNVDMFAAAGYTEAPKSYEELMEAAKKIYETTGIKGISMMNDVSFYQEALLSSLGSGLSNDDELGADCVNDGSMLKMLSDWRQGVDEGWYAAPAVTDSHDSMYQNFYTGNLAAFLSSSAVLGNVTTYGPESGINAAVAPMPVYGGIGGTGGGGDINIVASGNNEQQLAASWEFVKFMMRDEEIAERCKRTGYMPVTDGAAALMETFFQENPNYAIAYEARKTCVDYVSSAVKSDWNAQIGATISYVILDRSMTAEEGVEYLKKMYPSVFG